MMNVAFTGINFCFLYIKEITGMNEFVELNQAK